MARINTKAEDTRRDKSARLAGGQGPYAARQGAEAQLRRSVMACLLWEDLFYEDGISVEQNIVSLVPDVAPDRVRDIAIEARMKQKLRHVPLLLANEMSKLKDHRVFVSGLLPKIIQRADEIPEFLALYWKNGKVPISAQVKKGLAKAFENFDAYQFAKYDRDTAVKFRDVMRLVHPRPPQGKEEMYRLLKERNLPSPDTWEVALSAGKNKAETFTRLIREKKLGALAFLRNLRLMEQSGVPREVIQEGFRTINPRWLLPVNYLAAQKYASGWERELEEMMFRGLAASPKLSGHTIFIIDVSGSMGGRLSSKSEYGRIEVASALAMIASEVCESISVYATAGSDPRYTHATELLKPRRGFALMDEVMRAKNRLGGGGIFTRQCLEYIRGQEKDPVARIMVFSDSQDCDRPGSKIPNPFGKHNYIIDVSAHKNGINYKGVWNGGEIAGWSDHFLEYIRAFEGLEVNDQED